MVRFSFSKKELFAPTSGRIVVILVAERDGESVIVEFEYRSLGGEIQDETMSENK